MTSFRKSVLPEHHVIDLSGTLYVVVKTQEISGSTTNFVYRLHALDITTGAERPNSPVVIQGQVPGSGSPQNNGLWYSALSIQSNARH